MKTQDPQHQRLILLHPVHLQEMLCTLKHAEIRCFVGFCLLVDWLYHCHSQDNTRRLMLAIATQKFAQLFARLFRT